MSANIPASVAVTPIAVPATLEEAGPILHMRAAQIVTQLDDLMAVLNALPDTWTGRSSADYQILQQEWNVGAFGLFGGPQGPGVLNEIAQAMGVVYSNYSNCEWANTSTWSPGLGGM